MKISNIVTSVQMSDEYSPVRIKNIFDNLDGGFYIFIDVEDIKCESTKLFVKIYDNLGSELICLDFKMGNVARKDTIICYINYKSLENLPLSSFGKWRLLVMDDKEETVAKYSFVVRNIAFTYTSRGVPQ
ncbi:hypothetical protein GCM10022628_18450 [Anoxybacillus suryakundensis]|uniref:Uncharacterized protein n=1 Tax=Anoxybacillus suryakundensis TaxID=1325335 RepID=A0A0K6GKX2_9BACL|nr:hypothetical protein Ga0061060_10327 [Anoxybacillus suryakundensis]